MDSPPRDTNRRARVIPPQWTWVSTEHSGYQTADVLNALHECGHAEKESRGASNS
jgi:hypothetical protein